MTDITQIKRSLAARARDVAEYLLPRGRLEGTEWCIGDISGSAGKSLKVHIHGPKAGIWSDFADGKGGDLIDLWREVKGQSLPDALDNIRRWLGVETPKFERRARTYRRPERPKCSKPASAVLDYLTAMRGLTREAIAAYRIGEDDRTIIFPSLMPDGTLAFVKYLSIDRSKEGKKITRVEPGCEPVLFGWQAIDANAREITITEGEIDACSAWGYGFPALSVPFGGGKGAKHAWIESEFDRLAQFETIFLALDMDAEGDAAAEEIASRIGRHRCLRVVLPRKDMNECLTGGIGADEIRLCFDNARTLVHRFRETYHMREILFGTDAV